MPNLFLVKLSENDKRLLILFLFLIIFTFVVIGSFVQFMKRKLDKYGKGIDTYMHDMVTYEIVKRPSQFFAYVYQRETQNTVKKLMAPVYILIGIIVVFGLLGDVTSASASLKSLWFEFDWPTVPSFFGIKNCIAGLPKVTKNPVFTDPKSLLTYALTFGGIIVSFIIIRQTLIYIARLLRSANKSKEVFSKSLDDLNVEAH